MSQLSFKSINSIQFKACVERNSNCNHSSSSASAKRQKTESSSFAQQQQRFYKQQTAVADLAMAKEKKFHSSLLAISAESVPSDYVHEPVNLDNTSMVQIEKQCAIPSSVSHARQVWQMEVSRFEPIAQKEGKVSITDQLQPEFPFDEDELVRKLAAGDPVTEQWWRNRFAAARLLGSRMHCYIELHARGIAIPEPLIDGAFRQFLGFWRDCIQANELVPWRIEHSVCGDKHFGVVDALFVEQSELEQVGDNEPLHLYLFDWKRCSRSLMSSSSPIAQVKQQRHARQLELQRTAIHQQHKDMVQVVGMFLCRFYTDNDNGGYELVQVE